MGALTLITLPRTPLANTAKKVMMRQGQLNGKGLPKWGFSRYTFFRNPPMVRVFVHPSDAIAQIEREISAFVA